MSAIYPSKSSGKHFNQAIIDSSGRGTDRFYNPKYFRIFRIFLCQSIHVISGTQFKSRLEYVCYLFSIILLCFSLQGLENRCNKFKVRAFNKPNKISTKTTRLSDVYIRLIFLLQSILVLDCGFPLRHKLGKLLLFCLIGIKKTRLA